MSSQHDEGVEIRTPRLILATVLPEEYKFIKEFKAPADLWDRRGFHNPQMHLVTSSGPLKHRIPRIERDPKFAPLALRLAVLKESGIIIGSSGFHDFPDENGMIEIGLEVLPPYQRQGYATEILHGMWSWVIRHHNVKVLRYTVGTSNVASNALVINLGFNYVGQQMDDEDGPEDIYQMSSEDYVSKFDV